MFEWDDRKATSNLAKHGVSFDEATTVFADPRAFNVRDVLHSTVEPRCLLLGLSASGRVLTIVYTLRSTADGETIRIVSARPARRDEALGYLGTQD